MSAKHTPGPWIWADHHRGLFGAGPDNAVLNHEPYEGMWLGHERKDANARLIAAAPELLEALQMVVRGYGITFQDAAIRDFARDAIAKAIGSAA
jgi:hypothetical protein